jgi:glycosyltransferase involved in cell wall biosynthesis
MTRSTLRIVLVAGEDPGCGGIGTYTLELARGLVAEGHHVELALRGWEEDRVEQLDGLTVHRLTVPAPSWRRGTVAMLSRAHVAREAVVFASRVAQLVERLHRSGGVDVVEAPDFHASGLAAALHSPARGGARRGPIVVARLHTPSFLTESHADEPPTADTRLLERLERAAVRNATIVTAPSTAIATEVAARWGSALRRRVQVVPNPIDAERFCPQDVLAEPATLLIVGRIERLKGQEVAVDALPAIRSDIPGARLLLVGADSELAGGGSALAALRRRVAALGMPEDALDATGAVDRDELPGHFARASVCLVPSRFESFGYTCLEAMACGRAVVASATGGLAEIVNDGHDGLLVETGDGPALAHAAIALLSDPQLRGRIEHGARATVEQRFAAPVVARRVAALYADAASASGGP